MKKTYKASVGMWQLDCGNDHILHRVGSADYPVIRHAIVKEADVDKYEEVALADIPPYTEAEYKAKVEELIRQRYTASDEFALINNVMSGTTAERQREYADYQAYREECKRKAKELLSAPDTEGGR